MHACVRFHHFPLSKDGIEPYGKSVSLLCKLQVDLRRVKLSMCVSKVNDVHGTYDGDGIMVVCSDAQVLALRKVEYDSLYHTRRDMSTWCPRRPVKQSQEMTRDNSRNHTHWILAPIATGLRSRLVQLG